MGLKVAPHTDRPLTAYVLCAICWPKRKRGAWQRLICLNENKLQQRGKNLFDVSRQGLAWLFLFSQLPANILTDSHTNTHIHAHSTLSLFPFIYLWLSPSSLPFRAWASVNCRLWVSLCIFLVWVSTRLCTLVGRSNNWRVWKRKVGVDERPVCQLPGVIYARPEWWPMD